MKADLLENLIAAHGSGNERKFRDAVELLSTDEERKGNVALANRLRNAYKSKSTSNTSFCAEASPERFFSPQCPTITSPRDKDSMLELFEIIESSVRLEDVVLPENQTLTIRQIIEEQKNAEEMLKYRLLPSNRLLLCGPPGCGKTMTALSIGNALGLKIAYVRLDGLVSSYLGQTSTNLRKVFDSVKNQRVILFLDEFDSIAKKRDDGNELGELKRVVTTLLQNFDSMPSNVLLIAATNHEHLLDPAIWRRFNVTITLGLPDAKQRQTLMEKWFGEFNIDAKLNFKQLRDLTHGLNCSQIQEMVNAATKKFFISKCLTTNDVSVILMQQLTNHTTGGREFLQVCSDLVKRGLSIRQIAKSFGLPHTTLNYQLKEFEGKTDEKQWKKATSLDS